MFVTWVLRGNSPHRPCLTFDVVTERSPLVSHGTDQEGPALWIDAHAPLQGRWLVLEFLQTTCTGGRRRVHRPGARRPRRGRKEVPGLEIDTHLATGDTIPRYIAVVVIDPSVTSPL